MEIQEYLDLTVGKQNKFCRVVTTTVVYEGVYVCSKCLNNETNMVLRPTGQTRESLENVTCGDNPQCDPTQGIAISISAIKEIAFD